MNEKDTVRRFVFSDAGVRGEWVTLNNSWCDIKEKHQYPPQIEQQLGQAMAAVVLLAVTLKFKGSLILQTHSDGPLRMLVAQCDDKRSIRGMARYDLSQVDKIDRGTVFGQGHLVLTIEQELGEPYQGIVQLAGSDLAESLQMYFDQSEQLKTRLWLYANENKSVGLFLQELPEQNGDPSDWQRLEMLAGTVTKQEMLSLSCEQILHRLFNQEKVHLYEPGFVKFHCNCSPEKIENTLLSLGRVELQSILRTQNTIEVNCEFCNHLYSFDKVDVERVLCQAGNRPITTETQQ